MTREYTFDAFIYVFEREIDLDYAWKDVMEMKKRIEEETGKSVYVYEGTSDWWFNLLLHLCPRNRTMERWFCAENEYLNVCFGLKPQKDNSRTERYYLDELYEKLEKEKSKYSKQRMEGVLRHQRVVGVHTGRPLIGLNRGGEIVPIQIVQEHDTGKRKRKGGTAGGFAFKDKTTFY